MPHFPPVLKRPNPGLLLIFGASFAASFTYRHYTSTSSPTSPALNPHTFTPFTLVSKQPVSSSSSLFTLRHAGGASEPAALTAVRSKGVWSVQIKQPQLQIARAYTPLPPHDASSASSATAAAAELRLLIRREEKGEVSGYLHALPEQATVELRGPVVELEIPDEVDEVLFLAGGTGIAPAMQVAHALAGRGGKSMHVLWANRRREDCVGGRNKGTAKEATGLLGWMAGRRRGVRGQREGEVEEDGGPGAKGPEAERLGVVVQELEGLRRRFRGAAGEEVFGVDYFVDEEKGSIGPEYVLKRVRRTDLRSESGNVGTGKKLILVSGPEGFVKYWAGPKAWADGREVQGPLGGVLGQLNLEGWRVWKL